MLFAMTSGDLNSNLTPKSFFFTKVVYFQMNYPTPFVVCRFDSCFFFRLGAEKAPCPIPSLSEPAWNRVSNCGGRKTAPGDLESEAS